MKHVEACLSDREDRESSLHSCASSVALVEDLCDWWKPVYVRDRPDNDVLTSEEVL